MIARFKYYILAALAIGGWASPVGAQVCAHPHTTLDRPSIIAGCTAIITDPAQPDDRTARAYEFRARARRALGQTAEAIEDVEDGLQLAPDDPALIYFKGVLLDQLGLYDHAWRHAWHAISLAPDTARFYVLPIHMSRRIGDRRTATELLDHALSLDSGSLELLTAKSRFHEEGREFALALAAVDAALASDRIIERKAATYRVGGRILDGDLGLLLSRADLLSKLGDRQLAAKAYDNLVAQRRDEVTLTARAGFHRLGLSADLALGLADVDAALDAAPAFHPAHYERGMILLYLRRYEDAKQSLTQAIDLMPLEPYYWSRAIARRQMDDFEGSFDDFMMVVTRSDKSVANALRQIASYGYFAGPDVPADVTPAVIDALRACSLDKRCW